MDYNEYDHNEEPEAVIHASFGLQQAQIMAVAIGMLLASVNADILNFDPEDEDGVEDLMTCLSVKLAAEHMFTSLWTLLGMPEDQVADLLASTEGG